MTDRVIIVGDAHIGQAPGVWEEHLHRFIEQVGPTATHLLILGDLFEFWFEYRSVVPRRAFATLAKLRWLRDRGVRLTVLGGNHDRWGGDFWQSEMGADFHRRSCTIRLGDRQAFVAHGDGLIEQEVGGKLIHAVTRWKATERVFRSIHPDLGHRIVKVLSKNLADHPRTDAELAWVADGQRQFARRLFASQSDLDLVVLGHTHVPINEPDDRGRVLLNPGAWFDHGRYAVVEESDVKLIQHNTLDSAT